MKTLITILILCITSSAIAQTPSYVPTNGLIGWWPFNGNANDESGNGNNGTVNGATLTTDRNNISNAAYSFDGIDDFIQAPNFALAGSITFTCWVKMSTYNINTLGANDFIFFSNHSGLNNSSRNFLAGYRNFGAEFGHTTYLFDNSANLYGYYPTNQQPSANVWHQFVSVFNNGQSIKMYLDGVEFYSNLNVPLINNLPSLPIFFGIGIPTQFNFFNGALDDIGIWNRALTPTEITNLYNSINTAPTLSVSPASTTICPGTPTTLTASTSGSTACSSSGLPTSLQTGLVGYWPFCGNANDASGNGNNGTVNGATLTTDRFGNSGSAYSFDGNDWIEMIVPSLPISNNQRSVSVWTNVLNANPTNKTAMHYGNNTFNNRFALLYTNSNNLAIIGESNDACHNCTGTVNYSSSIATPGVWQHIVVNFNGNIVSVYIDGVLSYDAPKNFNTILSALRIGKSIDSHLSGEYFSGKIDDIAIWNRALTAAEIQQLYTTTTSNATYSWSPGGATTQSITVSPTTTTTYTVTATANGQSSTSTAVVTVTTPPTITASSSTICAGQSSTLTASTSVSSMPCPIFSGSLVTGLQESYSFCGNATNSINSVNNGIVTGAVLTTDAFGNANSAYSFNGSSDYISIPSDFLNSQSSTSTSFRVRFVKNANGDFCLWNKDGSWLEAAIYVTSDNKLGLFWAYPNYYSGIETVSNTIQNNTWYDVVVIIANNSGQIYINGVLQTSVINSITNSTIGFSSSGTCGAGVNRFGFQKVSCSPTSFFNGKLDEFQLYNRALTTAEIQQLYTQGQTTYSWSPGGATTPSITVSPTSTTTYTCSVTTNGTTCSSDQVITVNAIPTVNAGLDQSVCTGSNVTLSATGATTYAWSGGVQNGVAFAPTSSGTYTVTGTSNGCSATDVVQVTVNPLPTANAGTDFTKTCVTNPSGTLVGMTSVAGNTYAWTPAAGLSSASSANPTANPTATTTYTLTATNTASGCTATDQVLVTVNTALPTANAGADFTKTCVTNPSGTLVGMTSVAGNTYAWTPATGLSSAGSANPTATTTYTLTTTNTASGCTATDQVLVTVNTALPTANAGTDFTKTCVTNPSGTLVGMTSVAGNTYAWTPATGLSSASSANPTANPTATTTYTLTATNTASGCTATDQVLVTVNTALPTVNAGLDQTICQGVSTVLNASSNGTSLSWNNGVQNNISFVPSTIGTTTYTATATGSNGCTANDNVVVTVNPLPSAAVTTNGTSSFCPGSSVQLCAPTGTGYSYLWSGNLGTTQCVTISSSATTSVTVTNAFNCSATSAPQQVTVFNNPVASAGLDATITCVQNASGAQIGDVPNPTYTYSWTPATGLNSATIGNPIANPSTTTTYTLTVVNADGCMGSDQVTVTVNNTPPTANAGLDQSICLGASLVLQGSTNGASGTWNNGVTNGVPFTPSQAGITSYTYSTIGANGCVNNDQVSVTVNALPVANAGQGAVITCVQNVNGVQLGANPISGNTYTWTPTSGLNNSNSANPTATPNTSTTYTLLMSDANGCSDTAQVVVTVNNNPPIVAAGNDANVCNGDSLYLFANATAGSTVVWNGTIQNGSNILPTQSGYQVATATSANGCTAEDSLLVNLLQPTTSTLNEVACDEFVLNGNVYLQTGTYTQLLTNAAGCDSTITLNLTINLSPATPVVYVQNEVNLSTDVVPGQTYQWIYCSDLIPVPGATNPTFNPAANAIYAVVVTNNCGSDTSSCTTVSTIGLADHQQPEIAIYPNPNNGHFTILLPENNGSAKLEVLDLNGRIIFESILDEQANELHLETLSSGTYWLRINQQVPVPVTKY